MAGVGAACRDHAAASGVTLTETARQIDGDFASMLRIEGAKLLRLTGQS
jgi:hypothetical protein